MFTPNRALLSQPAPSRSSASAIVRLRSFLAGTSSPSRAPAPSSASSATKSLTTLQEANPRNLPEVWFNARFPLGNMPAPLGAEPNKPPDDRKVKLGKTLRILQEHLPTLLQTPLPQEVLSPNISLHLFPSTHPHLPTVSGRVAYMAALWTSPIAFNRMPVIGNVKLEILSERMVNQPVHFSPRRTGAQGEQLIVRWRTVGKGKNWGLPFINNNNEGGAGEDAAANKAPVGTAQGVRDSNKEFTGLFIFEFDGEGRVLSHTIEHVQEGGHWERGVGAKVVGLTDWLLGGIRNRGGAAGEGSSTPCPAFTRRDR